MKRQTNRKCRFFAPLIFLSAWGVWCATLAAADRQSEKQTFGPVRMLVYSPEEPTPAKDAYVIKRLTPKLDGAPEKWKNVPALTLDREIQCGDLNKWRGAKDLSARISIAWDAQCFYAFAEVTDNLFAHGGAQVLDGDAFYLRLDPLGDTRPRSSEGNADDLIITAARVHGVALVQLQNSGGILPPLDMTAKAIITPRADGSCVYELALPWTQLYNVRPYCFPKMKIIAGVNDDDGNGYKTELEDTFSSAPVWFEPPKNPPGELHLSIADSALEERSTMFRISSVRSKEMTAWLSVKGETPSKDWFQGQFVMYFPAGLSVTEIELISDDRTESRFDLHLALTAEKDQPAGPFLAANSASFAIYSMKKMIARTEECASAFAKLDKRLQEQLEQEAQVKDEGFRSSLSACGIVRAREMARLLEGSQTVGTIERFNAMSAECAQMLDGLKKRLVPLKSAKGEILRGFVSPDDLSVRPYRIYVPGNYRANTPAGLMVALHGSGADEMFDWFNFTPLNETSGEKNCLVLFPSTRLPGQPIAENDVLANIEDVAKFYNLDRDRIYLLGFGEGGGLALRIACHYPDLFAQVTPISAPSDFRLSSKYRAQALSPALENMLRADNPVDLAANLLNMRVDLFHAADDNLVPVDHARHLDAIFRAVNHPDYRYIERAQGGHGEAIIHSSVIEFLNSVQTCRRSDLPQRVTYSTFTPAYGRAYWIDIQRLEQDHVAASITATAEEIVKISTTNVSGMKIRWQALAKKYACKTLEIDGVPIAISNGQNEWMSVSKAKGPWKVVEEFDGAAKRRELSGPLDRLFASGPVLTVYGSHDGGKKTKKFAEALAKNWISQPNNAYGIFPIKQDSKVSDEELKNNNILLIGTPRSNTVLERLAPQLPLKFGDKTIELGKERFSGEDLGAMFIYPNPLNPEKYVAVYSDYSERAYDDYLKIHTKRGDFAIFNSTAKAGTPGAFLRQGFFTSQWQVPAGE